MILLGHICQDLKQLRQIIPKDLFVFAGLDKNIVISSSVNMIEIWDKEKYEASVRETLLNFGDLAEQVMGGDQLNQSNEIS